jgi:tRNA threonylcarbamoyladenosine biosynthesis protein TsaE
LNSNPGKSTRKFSSSQEDTKNLGHEFAERLSPGDIVGLYGELGTGKTQFVKGICEYFQITDKVNSPTFTIVNEYRGSRIRINHFDLYRLKNIAELKEIGFDNYNDVNSICLIEWADIADKYLEGKIIRVNFDYGEGSTDRIIYFKD